MCACVCPGDERSSTPPSAHTHDMRRAIRHPLRHNASLGLRRLLALRLPVSRKLRLGTCRREERHTGDTRSHALVSPGSPSVSQVLHHRRASSAVELSRRFVPHTYVVSKCQLPTARRCAHNILGAERRQHNNAVGHLTQATRHALLSQALAHRSQFQCDPSAVHCFLLLGQLETLKPLRSRNNCDLCAPLHGHQIGTHMKACTSKCTRHPGLLET